MAKKNIKETRVIPDTMEIPITKEELAETLPPIAKYKPTARGLLNYLKDDWIREEEAIKSNKLLKRFLRGEFKGEVKITNQNIIIKEEKISFVEPIKEIICQIQQSLKTWHQLIHQWWIQYYQQKPLPEPKLLLRLKLRLLRSGRLLLIQLRRGRRQSFVFIGHSFFNYRLFVHTLLHTYLVRIYLNGLYLLSYFSEQLLQLWISIFEIQDTKRKL